MSLLCLAPVFLVGCAAFGQLSVNKSRSGPADLVSPAPGIPITLRQVEERVRALPDGSSATDTATSTIYRDSVGRLRIERVPSGGDQPEPLVSIIDPTNGVRLVLSPKDKVAYRMVGPRAGEPGFARGVGGLGDALPPGSWRLNKERLGSRTIEGIEAEGERTTLSFQGSPSLTAVLEYWYSDGLKLNLLASATGPYGRHTARLLDLHLGEPDPALFTVPAEYKAVDIKMPGQQ